MVGSEFQLWSSLGWKREKELWEVSGVSVVFLIFFLKPNICYVSLSGFWKHMFHKLKTNTSLSFLIFLVGKLCRLIDLHARQQELNGNCVSGSIHGYHPVVLRSGPIHFRSEWQLKVIWKLMFNDIHMPIFLENQAMKILILHIK